MYFHGGRPTTSSKNDASNWNRPIKTEESSKSGGICSYPTMATTIKEEIGSTNLAPAILASGPQQPQVPDWGNGIINNAPQQQGQNFSQPQQGWNHFSNFSYNSSWPPPLGTAPTTSLPSANVFTSPPPFTAVCPPAGQIPPQQTSSRSFVPDPNNSKEIYEWVCSLNKNSSNSGNSISRERTSSSAARSRYKESSRNCERGHSPGHRNDRKKRYDSFTSSKDKDRSDCPRNSSRPADRGERSHRDEEHNNRDKYRNSQLRERGRDNHKEGSRHRTSRDSSPDGKKEKSKRSDDKSPNSRSYSGGKFDERSYTQSSKDHSGRRESTENSRKSAYDGRDDRRNSKNKESSKDGLMKKGRQDYKNDDIRGKRPTSSGHRSGPIISKRERTETERETSHLNFDFDVDAIVDEPDKDVLEEIGEVEKWVRSAPDDLYYERLLDGEVQAKERTKLLCEKFHTALILQAQTARFEAEALGRAKMDELFIIESKEIAAQKECEEKNRKKGKSSRKSKKCEDKVVGEISKENSSCIVKIEAEECLDQPNGADQLECAEIDTNNTSTTSLDSSEGAVESSVKNEALGTSELHLQSENSSSQQEEEFLPKNGEASRSDTMETRKTDDSFLQIGIENVKIEPVDELEEGEVDISDDQSEIGDKIKEEILGEAISSDEEFLNENSTENENRESKTENENRESKTENENRESKTENENHQSTENGNNKKSLCFSNSENSKSSSKTKCKSKAERTKEAVVGNKKQCNLKCNSGKKKGATPKKKGCSSSSSSSDSDTDSKAADSDSDSSDEDPMSRSDTANRELERRKKHPRRLHVELWHNDPGLMNDGPVCRCSAKAKRCGIRHGFYPGENVIPLCDPFSNNSKVLRHYRITISPPKNFLVNTPTVIDHDGHEYIFEGFSLFSHYQVDTNLPPCRVIRFNIRYDVFVEEEKFPDSFCVEELMLFEKYIFREILELVDINFDSNENEGCPQFHLMPRFVRQLPDNGKEILSMSRVLMHLLKKNKELVKEDDLHTLYTVEQTDWQNFADKHKGMIVTKWGMKPSSIRVDQIDRDVTGQEQDDDGIPFPLIVHFGIRPPQLSYAGNAGYQRAWRRYVKYRHLLSNMPKPSPEDKRKLLVKELKLQEMRTASTMKRDVTVAISAKGFRTTGVCCDLVQHAMLIPVLVAHLRFHKGLAKLEQTMNYEFKNRYLLQLAMTHPSYRENFGTNPDHARNALTNCGIRQPEYGDRRIHYASTRKRGINTLINIMARFGAEEETESEITHNERLEFLGDAVVEFVTSIHLFHIFPDLEEGGLATYRAAIVQNQHLAVLAQTLELDQFMLYAHGSDLCHDSELRHAMANCFEALMGALFLDGGLEVWSQINIADRVFGQTLFGDDEELWRVWTNYPKHPLQSQEPNGDRQWIKSHTVLQKLVEFEESIGVEFTHIRILARAFTDRSLGYNNLSRGSNQRLEFLGDTVLQLISSEYLYRHFPDHHEGHLSLLRSSLVNNRTQSLVCDDLGMTKYAMRGDPKSEMKTKDRADLLEAFLGALYIDQGLKHCVVFCSVCFFPRLNKSIIKQEWNDPKSKLQQCCLTLRAMDGREPDIPVYKVTESLGPTNTRIYIVAVYFRGRRLATAQGHSIQEAEMNAAALALEVSGHLFPQLHHQKRIIDKTNKKYS